MVKICHPSRVREITAKWKHSHSCQMGFQLFFLFFFHLRTSENEKRTCQDEPPFLLHRILNFYGVMYNFLVPSFLENWPSEKPMALNMASTGPILGLRQTPPHLSQWLMCNITSECEYEHFNMKRIDFCHRHGILMIGNNILIFFFLIKAIFPLIMEGLALCEIYIHSPCMMSAITTPNG